MNTRAAVIVIVRAVAVRRDPRSKRCSVATFATPSLAHLQFGRRIEATFSPKVRARTANEPT